MKNSISLVFFILFFTCSYGQTKFLGKTHQQVKYHIIDSPNLEIMESDWEHIHIVDNNNLRNIIFYFENEECVFVITTFQEQKDFAKQLTEFNINLRNVTKDSWIIPTDNPDQFHYIISHDEDGYDFIEESIISDNDLKDLN